MRIKFLIVFLSFIFVAQGAIYDCFLFNNEFELLEIRLHELYDHVDKFVLVESGEGHRVGNPKPYYFEQQRARFAPYLDKIVHVKLVERLETDDKWGREIWQRNQIMRGLVDCNPDDVIFISDVDEFFPAELVPKLAEATATIEVLGLSQKMYRWFLNRSTHELWAGSAATRYRHLKEKTPQEVRMLVRTRSVPLMQGGWHFTSMGGYARAQEKYFGITEGWDGHGDFISHERWKEEIKAHQLVSIDETFPAFVRENIAYLKENQMIEEVPL